MEPERDDAEMRALFPLDGREGPATPLSPEARDALVGNVLDSWDVPTPPKPLARWIAGGTILLALGIATLLAVRASRETTARHDVHAPPTSSVRDETRVPPASPVPTLPREGAAEVVSPGPSRSTRVTRATPPGAPRETEDLLERANAERRSGAYATAEATYRRVVELAPSSREAHVARVAAATIRLDQLHDPAGAARLYRTAMRGASGTLAAEAAFGLARASRELGDRATEEHALREVVTHHADSPYARLSARRLAELGVTTEPPHE